MAWVRKLLLAPLRNLDSHILFFFYFCIVFALLCVEEAEEAIRQRTGEKESRMKRKVADKIADVRRGAKHKSG